MAADSKPGAVLVDRRQIYRPFLENLNPIASPRILVERDLIVSRERDPRDEGPPIHVSLAETAELSRGTQMALVGGIGSGKTTELLLTQKVLSRHADAVNIFEDLAEYTDLSGLSPGAIIAVAGMLLYSRMKRTGRLEPEVESAYAKLREIAFGKTTWVSADDFGLDHDDHDEPDMYRVDLKGLLKRRLPPIQREVNEVKKLTLAIAGPLLEADAQITLLIDGLDRLIHAERFREFAEQDLQALRGIKISVIIVAPLLLWYDKSRFLQDYFDVVKHIPAASAGPHDLAFLRNILERRGAAELMDRTEVNTIARYSSGVLRDLLTLARSSAEYAYRDDQDGIGRSHVAAAIKQLGNRYLVGLGNTQKKLLRRLMETREFPIDNATARELLVNRQVLEYAHRGRESFAVHRALAKVLPRSA